MSPLIILIIIVSIGAFFYSDHVIPYTNLKTGALIYDVKHQRPELQIKEGMFYNGIEGYSIKIAKKNHKTNLLQNVMVYDHRNNKENVQVTVADSGYMKMTADESNIIFTLYNGYSYEEVDEPRKDRRRTDRKYPHQRYYFDKQVVVVELSGLDFSRTDEDLFKNNFQMLNLQQLTYFEDSLKKEYSNIISDFANTLTQNNYFKREEILLNDIKYRPKKKPEAISGNENKFQKPARDSLSLLKSKRLPEKVKLKNAGINRGDSIETNALNDSIIDSVLIAEENNNNLHKFNLDKEFNELAINEKNEAVRYALTYARAAQNSVDNSRKHFNYKQDRIRRHQIEWHRKFALPFACFVFFFIGAPLGAIVRRGGFGTPVVMSILLFIFYYILSISGEKFVREGVMPASVGMWISSFVLMPLGIFLTYKATTDSVILNSDTYFLLIKKFFNRFVKEKSENQD